MLLLMMWVADHYWGVLVTDIASERDVLNITLHMEHTNILLNRVRSKVAKHDVKTFIKKFNLRQIGYEKWGVNVRSLELLY